MKWEEVRSIYPNQFVKFEVLKSNIDKDKEYVEEVAVIGPIPEEKATEELLRSKDNLLVYHTSKENIVIQIRFRSALRRLH
ncbi:MAG: hypothetical protein H7X86_04460 [Gorillibacterium sp.]|nr:hypothetical protein [Gorillibacterium sp.]